jgi:hypothetical protein
MAGRELITLLIIFGGVGLLIQFSGLKIWHAVLVLVAVFISLFQLRGRRCTSSCPAYQGYSAIRPRKEKQPLETRRPFPAATAQPPGSTAPGRRHQGQDRQRSADRR